MYINSYGILFSCSFDVVLRLGLSWWSSGLRPELPLQGAWDRILVGELRSLMLCGVAKK